MSNNLSNETFSSRTFRLCEEIPLPISRRSTSKRLKRRESSLGEEMFLLVERTLLIGVMNPTFADVWRTIMKNDIGFERTEILFQQLQEKQEALVVRFVDR